MKKTNDIANEDKKFFKEYNAEKHVGLTGASLYTLDESETDDFIKWRKANHPTKEEVQSLKESNAALVEALETLFFKGKSVVGENGERKYISVEPPTRAEISALISKAKNI